MKKLIILLGFLLASSLSYSQLLEENFNYPVGDSLGAHGWVSFSGGSTNVLSVTAPGLTYPGYPLSGIGNATTLMSSGQDAYKDLSSSDSTGAIYVSFMVNVTSAQSLATGNYFFAFLPSTSTSFYSARFYASDSAGLRFGLSKVASSVGPIVYTTDTYALNTTYLVVLKYQFNPGSEDAECSAYIFESGFPSTEPSTPTIGPVTGTSPDISIGRIALRQGTASSSPLTQVDGILVSKSWLNNLNYPIANFTANNTVINAGGSVNFTNTSTNNPTVFNWFFPGGSPYTTTAENPSNIIYNTPGVYTVYLRVANAAGADSITKTNYITVNPLPCTPTWSNFLKISDAGNIKDSLKFGTSPTATIGIDPCFGETPQPPVPPTGAYDIRLILQNPPAYDASKIDIRPVPINDIFWKVKFQPSGSGYPITFSWNQSAFPSSGLFFLRDEITGTIVNINMKAQSSYVLTNPGITSLKIEYQINLISNVSVNSGWNILSVPLKANDMKFTNIFPLATSLAYNFNGSGYIAVDSAKVSKGYWLKFGRDTTYRIEGVSLSPKEIPVISGWNMIGPFDENIPVSSIVSTPSGIVTSLYYQYNNGYIPVDILTAGKGYWVKTSASGILMKNTSDNFIAENVSQSDSLNNFTKFTITDNNGSKSILYIGNASQISGNYDLPPVPPNGIFDVRFGSDKFVESYGQSNDIKLNSVAYPIKIKAENLNGHSFRLKDNVNGSIVNILIEDESEIELNAELDNLLLIDENLLPDSYSLSQNYPNPFNPTTKIKYQLPVDGNVKIIIFDLLGKEVQTLVNGFEKAGSYELTFNGINLASGIYFYKMKSENFSEIKRMILVK